LVSRGCNHCQLPVLGNTEHTNTHTLKYDKENIIHLLSGIPDPEIPVITISDLGILRDVQEEDGKVIVSITPTYSGCPAMKAIEEDIREKLRSAGITHSEVRLVYAPVWTTEWLSEEAKEKLRAYGISPPGRANFKNPMAGDRDVTCPRCGSADVKLVSLFGSTACKALYSCNACREPFDHFKCH
jgi:ring-1,2-phenylacetyl-CoA epoxidase subunit PaaD